MEQLFAGFLFMRPGCSRRETDILSSMEVFDADKIEYLLERGADPNVVNRKLHDFPLHIAVKNQCCRTIKNLIKHNARINFPNADFDRPLHVAVKNYHRHTEPVLETLLEYDVSLGCQDDDGKTAFHIAAESCNPELISKFIEYDFNPVDRDETERTPLHYVLDYCDVRVLEALKQKYEDNPDEPPPDEAEPVKKILQLAPLFSQIPQYIPEKPFDVMELTDDLYKRRVSVDNIITSAKMLIKYSLLRDVRMYKYWNNKQIAELHPEILNYINACTSEIRSMKNKKVTHRFKLYKLVVDHFYEKSYVCSRLSTDMIIKYMVQVYNKKGFYVYLNEVASKLDEDALDNKLTECTIYARSGDRKVFLDHNSIYCLCEYFTFGEELSFLVAFSILEENKHLFS